MLHDEMHQHIAETNARNRGTREKYFKTIHQNPKRKEQKRNCNRERRTDPKERSNEYETRCETFEQNPQKRDEEKQRHREKAMRYYYDTLRRKRYESTDIDSHDKLIQRSIETYNPDLCPNYKPPEIKVEKYKSTCMHAAEIVNPDHPNLKEVEDKDVWNTEYFEQWSQYCYDCDSDTGKINKNNTLHPDNVNTLEHLCNLIRIDNEKMNNICMKTCCKCYERWFDTRTDSSKPEKQQYIKKLDMKRARNKFKLSPAEVKKYADLYANENGGARPEHTPEFIERLRIRSLVQLTEDPDYICDACNPDKYRYDGKKRAAKTRQKQFSPWNFAVPPPPFPCEYDLKPEDRYMCSRASVVMRVSNRANNPEPKCQSKRTGHTAILPLDHARVTSDYLNSKSLPRKKNSLVYLRGVQETKGVPYVIKLQPHKIKEVLETRQKYNNEYKDIHIDESAIEEYSNDNGLVELKPPDNFSQTMNLIQMIPIFVISMMIRMCISTILKKTSKIPQYAVPIIMG